MELASSARESDAEQRIKDLVDPQSAREAIGIYAIDLASELQGSVFAVRRRLAIEDRRNTAPQSITLERIEADAYAAQGVVRSRDTVDC